MSLVVIGCNPSVVIVPTHQGVSPEEDARESARRHWGHALLCNPKDCPIGRVRGSSKGRIMREERRCCPADFWLRSDALDQEAYIS